MPFTGRQLGSLLAQSAHDVQLGHYNLPSWIKVQDGNRTTPPLGTRPWWQLLHDTGFVATRHPALWVVGEMLVVETIARIRRVHFVQGKTIKAMSREFGIARNTIRRILRSGEPMAPAYRARATPVSDD